MTDAEKARTARNEYYRQYRAKNKEKVKAINTRYWANKADKKAKEEANVNTV